MDSSIKTMNSNQKKNTTKIETNEEIIRMLRSKIDEMEKKVGTTIKDLDQQQKTLKEHTIAI
jgi:peptidoglycan hydrolase CwlO-like protein